MLTSLIIGCLISLVCGLGLTYLLRQWLPRIGLVDMPDGRRKTHRKPMPVGGGLAVFIATSLALLVVLTRDALWRDALSAGWLNYAGLWVACLLVTVLGLVDDSVQLRGRQKLVGQVLVALVIVASGVCIRRIELFGLELEFGVFAMPFTMLWLIGTINALNLLDGIDGLATVIGIIISLALATMALLSGHFPVAMICLLFAAGLIGFLVFNYPPASIFLGDTGSMLIGTVIGALAIKGSLKTPGTVLLAAPLAALAIPFLDSFAAIVRRKLTGRSLYSPDRDHLHHRFTWRLRDNRTVLLCLAAICAVTSFGGIATVYWGNDMMAAITVLAIVGALIALRLFGDGELRLLLQHTTVFGRTLWESTQPTASGPRRTAVRFRGSMPWEEFWEVLTDTAEKLHLRRISLHVNLWSLGEVYHAKWNDGSKEHSESEWSVRLPLFVRDGQVGHVAVTGLRDGQPMCEQVEMFLTLIEPFEQRFERWCDHLHARPVGVPVALADEGIAVSSAAVHWSSANE
jgi:UDP-GlcNAc:undecaprenyl-phosphate GlcNAc-1-phosphate transferase